MDFKKDIIIIGGGASGIFAAIKAKEKHPDKKVAILEAQSRIGRKLLSTGNGRCNLSNAECSKSNYHGSFRKYLDTLYELCSVDRVMREFGSLGLMTVVREEGRIYPISNHAGSVLDVLRFRLEAINVEIITDTKVENIKKENNLFKAITDRGTYISDKIIVSTGSCATPKLGADASGINMLKELGHNVTPLSPALCPVKVKSDILKSLKGVRIEGKVSLFDNETFIREEFGEIQFNDKNLSGICVFNLSSLIKKVKNPIIELDLLPYTDNKYLFNILNKNKELYNNRTIDDFFTGIFIKKLGMGIMKQAGITPFSRLIGSLNDKELGRIAKVIKGWRFMAEKSSDYSQAQVVSGGVIGNEINPYSMESLVVKGLYICGEAIDIDGECGGYNLQFAFSSGIIAGENI